MTGSGRRWQRRAKAECAVIGWADRRVEQGSVGFVIGIGGSRNFAVINGGRAKGRSVRPVSAMHQSPLSRADTGLARGP
jgi:hypothetical protein